MFESVFWFLVFFFFFDHIECFPKYCGGIFPCGSGSKESACNVRDLGSILGLGRSPGEGKGYPLQYSCLENFHGQYSPWGHKESDGTEWLSLSLLWRKLKMNKIHPAFRQLRVKYIIQLLWNRIHLFLVLL